MKRAIQGSLAFILGLAVFMVSGHGEEPKQQGGKGAKKGAQDIQALMRDKLKNAQKILEAIALNDFKNIDNHAQELIVISNKAEWRVVRTPRYEFYSDEFRRAAEDMSKHAKDKNIDAATLAYVQMTLNCVRCHKHVREVRMTRLEGSGSPLLAE